MVKRGRRGTVVGLFFVALSTAGSSCDSSGIGAFDRTPTAQYAVRASVDDEGRLVIVEQQDVAGRALDPSLAGAGEPASLRDPFGYAPEPGMTYLMLIGPAVEVHQDPEAGAGQYSLLYLHETETDLPSRSFPTGGIHGDLSPEEFLDCVQSGANAATRFDAIVAAVDAPEANLFYDCI